MYGRVGPAWTRGEVEAPAGERDMGGWVSAAYTREQQIRLGVDAAGEPAESARIEQLLTSHLGPRDQEFVVNGLLTSHLGPRDQQFAAAGEEPAWQEPVLSTAGSTTPRTLRAAEDALDTTMQVIAALRADLGIADAQIEDLGIEGGAGMDWEAVEQFEEPADDWPINSPGEVAPNAFLDDIPIPAPVGHRSPWHMAPKVAVDTVQIPKPSRGAAVYYQDEEETDDEAWSDDDVPRSPGEIGALRREGSFRGFDAAPIPRAQPIAETDIDEMLLREYERELEENELLYGDDGGMLMRTASGSIISKAGQLMEESQQTLMQLAEDGLREELEMADADLEAWESLGGYAEGFSPKAGWNKLEQAAEFLAEGDVFMEEQRERGVGDKDSEEEYGVSPALAADEAQAYLQWEQEEEEFDQDGAMFEQDLQQIKGAFADAAEGLRNPSFGIAVEADRPTGLRGPVMLGQQQRQQPQEEEGRRNSLTSSELREIRARSDEGRNIMTPAGLHEIRARSVGGGAQPDLLLTAVQQEIAALRAELGVR